MWSPTVQRIPVLNLTIWCPTVQQVTSGVRGVIIWSHTIQKGNLLAAPLYGKGVTGGAPLYGIQLYREGHHMEPYCTEGDPVSSQTVGALY